MRIATALLVAVATALPAAPSPAGAPDDPYPFSRPALTTRRAPHASVLADITEDGRPDLVTAIGDSTASYGVSVMPARASGGFAQSVRAAGAQALDALQVLDLDLDGHLDALGPQKASELHVAMFFRGTGTAQMDPGGDLGLEPFDAMAAGRFLAGQPPMVAIGTAGEPLRVYRRGPAQALVFVEDRTLGTGDAQRLLAVDMDGDAVDELVAARADGSLTVYRGLEPEATAQLQDVVTLRAADVTGDGLPEVVAVTFPGRVVVYNGSLGTVKELPPASDSAVAAAAGDLDGDGRPDLVRAHGDQMVDVFFAAGGTRTLPAARAVVDLLVHDATGDGNADVLAVEPDSHAVEVIDGDGAGGFAPQRSTFTTGPGAEELILRDVNGDGKLDIIANEYEYGLINTRYAHVLLGDGTGRFTLKSQLFTDGQPGGLAVGDFNGDDKPDVAIGDFQLGVAQFLGNGDGTFGPRTPLPPCRLVTDLASADFDGDGYDDVAALCRASFYPEYIGVLAGSPAGLRLQTVVETLAQSDGNVIRAGDLNGDGRSDIAVGHYNQTISVAMGGGPTGFGEVTTVNAPARFNDFALGDLNGDGRDDIVAPLTYQDEVWVSLTNAAGVPGEGDTFGSYEYPFRVTLADMDGDGRLDLVMGHGPNVISTAPGRGDGIFGEASAFIAQNQALGDVPVGDVNHDGKPDVVAAQQGSGTAEVFLQGA